MIRPKQIGVIIFLLLIAGHLAMGQSVNVPLEHWCYQFLERMEAKGLFESTSIRALPLSRMELAKILAQIEGRAQHSRYSLTTTERDQLEQLKGEFHEELTALDVKFNPGLKERHLVSWSEHDYTIHADFDFGFRLDVNRGDQYPKAERTSHTTLGGVLRGQLKNSLGFHVFVRNTIHRGLESVERNFDPSRGTPINYAGKNAYTDEAIAYLVWKLPWFQLQIGRDRAKWGPGYHGSLMLSAQNPLFDIIKLTAQYRRFNFTSLHAHLNSSLGKKYLAAHRLEIQVTPWLLLAGSEAVVYGNRGIEFQYLNPLMPYHVAEHHLGDRDNNTIGFDVTMFPVRTLKTYFELFIDDYTLSRSVFLYYGNKFAFLAGGLWLDPLGLTNSDLRIEYARVEPFVYTHERPINIYQNYNQCMGHWLGPNADDWFFETNYSPNRDLRFSGSIDLIRKGAGQLTRPWDIPDGTRKRFLSGVVEKRQIFGLKVTDQIFRDAFLSLNAYWINSQNLQQIKGKNALDRQINFTLLINY
ncbi:MAG: capsule assembly Wzi family protein [candidate division KSB1 bacterium]|nr:capsule assembly Wzi family protein [candidate division KSB1 bacterium]MDZ7335297.1 capsule assembly Wzi family protein [candidate division KSB1 bacterium]MDZ7357221.1 capsule assembly Wzi family protein [candidate division KSB1 bacterium]MDZ7399090.1 capsule assembly Wzi family protein [candidate division KSB1 bacterium]